MDLIEIGVTLNIAFMSVNTLFLWSLHAKVTEMETNRKNCSFCQSDTSTMELEKMRRGIEG